MDYEYSEKEIQLLDLFGFGYLINHMAAPALYRVIIEHAFVNDLKGPEVESLRRVAKALNNSGPYRMTKEFDDLIKLGEKDECDG